MTGRERQRTPSVDLYHDAAGDPATNRRRPEFAGAASPSAPALDEHRHRPKEQEERKRYGAAQAGEAGEVLGNGETAQEVRRRLGEEQQGERHEAGREPCAETRRQDDAARLAASISGASSSTAAVSPIRGATKICRIGPSAQPAA
jgi:hypothetical protein